MSGGISALIAAALLSALSTAQARPTEADWDWLREQGWQVIEKVMPVAVRSSAVATFRSHRDLYQDVPEQYFQIAHDMRTDVFTAVIVVPEGKSLQQQLLDLRVGRSTIGLADAERRIRFRRVETTDAHCPELRKQMNALSQLEFGPPQNDSLTIHPMVYRVVLGRSGGSLDARLHDEDHPLVMWALATTRALGACAQPGKQ